MEKDFDINLDGREIDSNSYTINELAEAIHNQKETGVTAVKAVQYHLDRLRKYNGQVNSIVRENPDAMAQAAEVDRRLAAGEYLPLAGIPFTVKDTYETEGILTEAGGIDDAACLEGYLPTEDAELVAKLKRLGAILIGKTATPPLAVDVQTHGSHGVTNNPYDLTKTPGGSSGGCAASIAAGFSMFSIGSDAGGSARVPAAYCGVTGHKVSKQLIDDGTIPKKGHIPPLPGLKETFDVGAPAILAQRVEDVQFVMEALGAIDKDYAHQSILTSGTRIGYLDTDTLQPEKETIRAISEVIKTLVLKHAFQFKDSADLNSVDLREVSKIWAGTFGRQISESIASKKIGKKQRQIPSVVAKLITRLEARKYLKAIKKAGGRLGNTETHFIEALQGKGLNEISQARAELREKFERIWDEVDVVIMPTSAMEAFHHTEQFANIHPTASYYDATITYTALANVIGAAATSVRWSTPDNEDGGISIQIIAKTDEVALRVARVIDEMNKEARKLCWPNLDNADKIAA